MHAGIAEPQGRQAKMQSMVKTFVPTPGAAAQAVQELVAPH